MVETRGVEPLTSAMPLQRSAKLSYVPGLSMQNAQLRMHNAEEAIYEFSENMPVRQGICSNFTMRNGWKIFTCRKFEIISNTATTLMIFLIVIVDQNKTPI